MISDKNNKPAAAVRVSARPHPLRRRIIYIFACGYDAGGDGAENTAGSVAAQIFAGFH